MVGNMAAGGGSRGAVFIFRGFDQTSIPIASAASGLVAPVAAALTPDRRLCIADAEADPLGLGMAHGAVWLVDPAAPIVSPPRLLATNPLFRRPADIMMEPEGTILLLDSEADPGGWGSRNGALFRIDPATGNVSVLAAPEAFRDPRSLALDLDGAILVVDETANPLGIAQPAGAIFRVNPSTGAVTTERAFDKTDLWKVVAPTAVAVIPKGEHRGDFLLVDRNASPYGRLNQPGAVFRVPRSGGEIVNFTASEVVEFSEPVDILMGLNDDVYVLDQLATSAAQAPDGRGAIFRFRLDDGVLLESPRVSNSFRGLDSFSQMSGAQLDSSLVTWDDETPGVTTPGDFFTARARVRNTGTADAPSVSLEDTLRAPLQFVYGSDSMGTGRAAFDPLKQRFSWTGALGQGDETTVRFRLKIADTVLPGAHLLQRLVLRTDQTPSVFIRTLAPQREFSPGSSLFLDFVPVSGGTSGIIYWADGTDATQPDTLASGGPLVRPADSVFLEDGRLVVLDPGNPAGNLGALLVYSFHATDTLRVLFALRRGEPWFVKPTGLALDRDGSLLIIDKDANPQGYAYTPADPRNPDPGPGAVFRFNVDTRQLSVAAADPGFHEPLDAVVDRRGTMVVVDYVGGRSRQGVLWEVPRVGPPREIEFDPRLFLAPSGLTVDAANDLYVCSFRAGSGPNPDGGAIFRVHRAQSTVTTIACADTLLREPVDIAVNQQDGTLLVADRAANPLHLPAYDRGAVFKLNPSTGQLSVAAASGLMRQPDGVVSLGWADLSKSRFSLRTKQPGDVLAGDSLWADVQLVNSGLAASPQTLAAVTFSQSTVRLLPVDPPVAGLAIDTLASQAAWTGRLAWGDTVRFSIPGVVRSSASYGEVAEVSFSVQGGRTPYTDGASRAIRSSFSSDDLVLIDNASDPERHGRPCGAVFGIGPEPLTAPRLIYSQTNLLGVAAAEWGPAGGLLLATDPVDGPGAVYRFDSATGTPFPYGTVEPRMMALVDLLVAPDRDLLVVDREARGMGPWSPSRGALFVRHGMAPYQLYCADSTFRGPTQATFGPGGMLYLADPSANPDHVSGNTGAVYTIDPGTRKVVGWLQVPALPEPTGVIAYDDSTLLVSDSLGANPSIPNGTLMLYRPQSSRPLELLYAWNGLKSLWRTIRRPDGSLLLLERRARHTGQTGLGEVRSFDPATRRFSEFAWSDSFLQVSDLVAKPGPIVTFTRYDGSDVNGPPLHPADRIHWRAVMHSVGAIAASGVAYCDSFPAGVSVIPETAETSGGASQGVISFDGSGVLRWSGTIVPGDSAVISYDVQLNPAMSDGRLLEFHPTVLRPGAAILQKSVKLQTYVPLQEGFAYMVDLDADPFSEYRSGQAGALFKVNLATGAVTTMMTSRLLRRPTSVALVGSSAAPRFLILDTVARTPSGRVGTVFLYDPVTGELLNLGGHRAFEAPVKVLPWTETTALVLDSKADPDSLHSGTMTGPGAIFRLDLDTETFTPVFSDTTLKMPVSMAWLAPGILAITDEKADPNGPRNSGIGAIYRLDLGTRNLRLFASSSDWRTPGPVCSDLHGGLLVVDRNATPIDVGGGYGSVYKVASDGTVARTYESRFFGDLRDVQAELDGDPLVADGKSDPYYLGGTPGAILRWVTGRFIPVSSSRVFRTPSGFVVYGDPTPVSALEAVADSTGEGIRLRWHGGTDESGARWLVYRREGTGPDDPGDAAPEGYDPVGGDHEFVGAGPHEYLDRGIEGGRWYVYLVARVSPDGGVDYSTPLKAHAPEGVARLELLPAAPSPFSARTNLAFMVPAPGGRAELAVFDVAGRRVRVLYDGPVVAGRYAVGWDGHDDRDQRLASGVYFARLSLGGETRNRRIVLMR
jgi:sugar lactone lactonase YvrE